jgi:hypothetical protein
MVYEETLMALKIGALSGRRIFWLALLLTVLCEIISTGEACDCSAGGPWHRLTDPSIGFSLCYPADWSVGGQVIATQFAVGAKCRSVRMIDFAPLLDSGAAAAIEQSLVQVCAKPLEADGSLDQYMRRVYGDSLEDAFAITDLNGTPSYQSAGQGKTSTIFAQFRNSLIQIVATVAASPKRTPERQAQVKKILESFALL